MPGHRSFLNLAIFLLFGEAFCQNKDIPTYLSGSFVMEKSASGATSPVQDKIDATGNGNINAEYQEYLTLCEEFQGERLQKLIRRIE